MTNSVTVASALILILTPKWLVKSFIIDFSVYEKMFFYNLSFGILSWASIQSAALLSIYFNIKDDVRNVLEDIENKRRDRDKTLKEKIFSHPQFKDYVNSIFWGWVISCLLALMSLFFIVVNPTLSKSPLAYHGGAIMFSVFCGLLFFLYLILKDYRNINSKPKK